MCQGCRQLRIIRISIFWMTWFNDRIISLLFRNLVGRRLNKHTELLRSLIGHSSKLNSNLNSQGVPILHLKFYQVVAGYDEVRQDSLRHHNLKGQTVFIIHDKSKPYAFIEQKTTPVKANTSHGAKVISSSIKKQPMGMSTPDNGAKTHVKHNTMMMSNTSKGLQKSCEKNGKAYY